MHKIYAELRALSLEQILLALAGVVLSYLAVTGYDTLALRYAGKPLAYARTAFASFTSYALSNTLGLPLLTGSAVRYRLYSSWGLGAKEIGILAIITGVTLYVGALAIGGAGLQASSCSPSSPPTPASPISPSCPSSWPPALSAASAACRAASACSRRLSF